MADILLIVFPIFTLIGLGYGVVIIGLVPQDVGAALSKFVFTIPLPLLLFRNLATNDLTGQAPWPIWGAYFPCLFAVWILGMILLSVVFKREGKALAVAGISAGFSNLVLLGIPMITGVYGEDALLPLLMLLTVHLPAAMLVSSILVEWYDREEGKTLNIGAALVNVGKGLATNPIVVGIVAGGLWSLTGFDIPQVASVVIDKIVPVTVPLALMSLGMGMRKYGLSGDILSGFLLALMKTMLLPTLFLLITSTLVPLPAEWVAVILIGAACPTGVNAYLLAEHFGVGHRVAANTLTLSVLMGLVTLPFWISISHQILGR